VTTLHLKLRGALIAIAALALSAGMAAAAQPSSTGLANASVHAGKTLPVQAGKLEAAGDEDADEGTETDADADESSDADNCATDPTALNEEQLTSMRHGSIACWAAQQTEWPEWFANHGAFVRCWAHQGKSDAASCTVDPATAGDATGGAPSHPGRGKGRDK
jgi:hypothetical protein